MPRRPPPDGIWAARRTGGPADLKTNFDQTAHTEIPHLREAIRGAVVLPLFSLFYFFYFLSLVKAKAHTSAESKMEQFRVEERRRRDVALPWETHGGTSSLGA